MILIRECRGFDELQACVDLQIEVWGYSDGDVIPRRVFLVSQKIGGQVIGAFDTSLPGAPERGDAGSMVGFSFSLPGVKATARGPKSYLHSHMLAVRDGYRNQRIGARLKLAQREDALRRGFDRIEWTFDPVEIKNAFLNIHKLGAIVRRYEENFYGVSSSRLQGGLQTDRLVAEWLIGTPHVVAAIEGKLTDMRDDGCLEKIHVPAPIYRWKAEDQNRHLAQQVQAENRAAFQRAFSTGLAVVAFTRDGEGNGTFHLGRWEEPGTGLKTRLESVLESDLNSEAAAPQESDRILTRL